MPFSPFAFRRTPNRHPAITADERRFALGERSVADLVAPAAVEVARDHLRLDAQYARTLVVTGYPRSVNPGWLSPLIDFEEALELSLHRSPPPPAPARPRGSGGWRSGSRLPTASSSTSSLATRSCPSSGWRPCSTGRSRPSSGGGIA